MKEILLENAETRQIKTQFMLPETYADALEIITNKYTNNNHRKDWVILKSSKGKEPKGMRVRKVVKSTKDRVLTKH